MHTRYMQEHEHAYNGFYMETYDGAPKHFGLDLETSFMSDLNIMLSLNLYKKPQWTNELVFKLFVLKDIFQPSTPFTSTKHIWEGKQM